MLNVQLGQHATCLQGYIIVAGSLQTTHVDKDFLETE